jgi:hypothetical protein
VLTIIVLLRTYKCWFSSNKIMLLSTNMQYFCNSDTNYIICINNEFFWNFIFKEQKFVKKYKEYFGIFKNILTFNMNFSILINHFNKHVLNIIVLPKYLQMLIDSSFKENLQSQFWHIIWFWVRFSRCEFDSNSLKF